MQLDPVFDMLRAKESSPMKVTLRSSSLLFLLFNLLLGLPVHRKH
jgi:hypothetical protein